MPIITNDVVEEVVEEVAQVIEPVEFTVRLETIEQFKDFFHRFNISSDRVEEEYFEEVCVFAARLNPPEA